MSTRSETHPDEGCTKCVDFCCTCELCECCIERLRDADRLRALITAWADACDQADKAGATQVDEIAWKEIDALRKAVGR